MKRSKTTLVLYPAWKRGSRRGGFFPTGPVESEVRGEMSRILPAPDMDPTDISPGSYKAHELSPLPSPFSPQTRGAMERALPWRVGTRCNARRPSGHSGDVVE